MRLDYTGPTPERLGFLLLPRFSMMAFFSAIEPLRIANRIRNRTLFEWVLISEDGEPVSASNGMTLVADCGFAEAENLSSLAVCSGFEPDTAPDRSLVRWLHRLDAGGSALGGLDTGCFLLAAAGLLNQQRVTLHWESLPAFQEKFPFIATSDELFELDKRRFSCAGGAAAMDMALAVIAHRHGDALAVDVSEQLIHERMRTRYDQQRMTLARRLGTHKRRLVDAVALMEQTLENPLTVSALARRCGITARQLQRLFAQELGCTPLARYLTLRLEKARHLLLETDLDILSVGLACGFSSGSSFARAFRAHFGCTPRALREHRGA